MFIENNGLLITILLIVVCCLCFVPAIIREIALAERKNVSFNNYPKKKRLFNLHSNKIILISYLACAIIVIVFGIFLATSNVTKIYSIITMSLLVILFMMALLELRINKTNKNIEYYDELYSKVNESQQSLISIQSSIDLCEEKYKSLVEEKNNIINEFNRCFKIQIDSKEVDNKLNSFSKMIDDLRNDLSNYDKTLITFFDNSIHTYIYDGNISTKDFITLTSPDNNDFEKGIGDVINEFKNLIINKTNEGLCYDYFNDDESLISVFELNEKVNINLNQYSELLITYINNNRKEKKNLVSYAQDKSIITLNNVLDIINKNDYSWYYINSIPKAYETNSMKLVESILYNDSIECAYAILTNYSNVGHVVEKIMNNTIIKNDVYDIFEMYISLNNVSNGFNNESNKFENMSFALLNYYNNASDKAHIKKYNDIINDRSFAKNQIDIEKEYKTILDVINNYSNSYINLLVLYGKSVCRDYMYIDYNKSLYLFQEFKSNLNLNGIHTLCMILEAIILIEEKDSSIINPINSLLDEDFKGKTHIESGRKIIDYLNKKNRNDFIRILYRIEKQRLSYDALMRL